MKRLSRQTLAQNRRLKDFAIHYYWPHKRGCDGVKCDVYKCPQYLFHIGLAPTRAYFGGNRSGKTTASIVELAFHTTGEYPEWYPKEGRYEHPIKARLFAEDFKKGVGEVITPTIEMWFPKGSIKNRTKNNQGVYDKYWINGKYGISVFDIMTYEQESRQAEGWSGHLALFDEPPPRDHRIATKRGLVDFGGREIFTLTPIRQPWLFDEIYSSEDESIATFTADIRDNLQRVNPLTGRLIGLAELDILEFEKILTEEEKEVRLHGKFRYLAGRIWKMWERNIHTKPRSIWESGQPPKDWPRMLVLDPHDRLPFCLLWITKDPTGDYYCYREGVLGQPARMTVVGSPGAVLTQFTIPKVTEYIRDIETKAREKVNLRVMDPNFGAKRYGNSGLTVRDEFEQAAKYQGYPITFKFGDDNKVLGRQKVRELLQYEPSKPISFLNHPKLYIIDDLKNVIYQIEHYLWDEYKLSERDPKEEAKDENTHFPDCLMYGVLDNLASKAPEVINLFGGKNPYA